MVNLSLRYYESMEGKHFPNNWHLGIWVGPQGARAMEVRFCASWFCHFCLKTVPMESDLAWVSHWTQGFRKENETRA